MSTSLKIKVVQYMWGDHNLSYPLDRKINEVYCMRHGYEHVVYVHHPRNERFCRWEKIPVIQRELGNCDFLLFLDADAFFYSQELTIEEELLPLLGNKDIMMAVDNASEKWRHHADTPNTGVILIRNSTIAFAMLDIWDQSSKHPDFENFRFKEHHKHDACFYDFWQEYRDNVKLVKDYYLLNGLHGIYIRHLMASSDDRRLSVIQEYIDKNEL